MKKLLTTLVLAGLCQTATAAIHIHDAWARSSVEGMSMSGAFMQIHNDSDDDALIGASSPIMERAEIHTSINDNGVMRMREVKDGVPLLKNASAELKPGSYHIMLMGLKKQLKAGETIPLTLTFKKAKPQTVNVVVKNSPTPAAAPKHDHAAHQH